MSFSDVEQKLLKYVGASSTRVLTKTDLTNLGATADQIQSLGEATGLSFLKGLEQRVEAGLAHLIADHPSLTGEFQIVERDVENDLEPVASTADPTTAASGTSSATETSVSSTPATDTPPSAAS